MGLGSKCFGVTISPIRTEPPATEAGAPDASGGADADADASAGADADADADADVDANGGAEADVGSAALAACVGGPAHPPGRPLKNSARRERRQAATMGSSPLELWFALLAECSEGFAPVFAHERLVIAGFFEL